MPPLLSLCTLPPNSLLSREQDLVDFFNEDFLTAQSKLDRKSCKKIGNYVDEYNAAIKRFRASRTVSLLCLHPNTTLSTSVIDTVVHAR